MQPLLQLEGISKSFWGIRALDGAGLSVARGEVHALTGENGAGKSTLMKIVAGIERPDSGAIRFTGSAVAMIHQELLPFPEMTVAENICMGAEPANAFGWLDKSAMHHRAAELLARLGVDVMPGARMGDLSFAEQQSVEISKAVGQQADLLIMDEPTSALSDRECERLFRIIGDLKQRGVAVIYISHRMDEIFRLADTITVMRDGRPVATRPASGFDEATLISLMVGRDFDAALVRQPAQTGEVALEVRKLTREAKFRDITFTLRAGEILGLAGLIGAGRTEIASAIFGLDPAGSGDIVVRGRSVRIGSPADALAQGIAMVTEDRKRYGFVGDMGVRENVTLSSLRRYSAGGFVRRGAEDAAADEQIRALSIRAAGREQQVKYLSGGNQQKVVLARALLSDPAILILDEPTRGVDVGAKAEIYGLIARLARQGKAILLVSSEMNEILALSDRILVIREGAIAAEVTPSRTTPEEILSYAMPQ
ncbi:MAG: sugar ABC transporter ATP-binding protein [Acidobacteria bacterium]|nr:sugar ABC transporter ATP-binding protein [Acidobacteriota bacterium]